MSETETETSEPQTASQKLAERIVNGPWPITMTLQHPIEFGKNETITELVFQKGRFEFLKGMSIGEAPTMEQMQLLAARLCGRSLKVIESIDPDDVQEVLAHALGFMARCRAGGKGRSAP